MENDSTDADLIQLPAPSHPRIPAPRGGYLLVASDLLVGAGPLLRADLLLRPRLRQAAR